MQEIGSLSPKPLLLIRACAASKLPRLLHLPALAQDRIETLLTGWQVHLILTAPAQLVRQAREANALRARSSRKLADCYP